MNNKLIIGIVAVAAILVVIFIIGGRSEEAVAPTGSVIPTVSASTSATVRPGATAVPASLNYQDAIKKYGSNRIQFNAQCQANISSLTIKNGMSIMLDNRASTARTISVGTVKYALVAYGYRIITPTSATLPATLLIDCGTAQNVSKVIIQK